MDNEHTFYRSCPISGIVCILCQYPVPNVRSTIPLNIAAHEQKNKMHTSGVFFCTTEKNRTKIEKDFECEMQLIVDRVTLMLPDIDAARSEFTSFLGRENSYPFCSAIGCQCLVHCKKLHKSKQHISYCKTYQRGYMSKFWLKKQPRVVPVDFSFDQKSHFCGTFWKLLQLKLTKPQLLPLLHNEVNNDSTSTSTSQIYDELQSEQQECYDSYQKQLQLSPINHQKYPNLWLRKAGWDYYLKDFLPVDIYNTTISFNDTPSEAPLKAMEITLKKSILHVIDTLLTIPCHHHIFLEVERRPSEPFPSKPFNVAMRPNSWLRYIRQIQTIFRVVLRLYIYNKFDDTNVEDDSTGSAHTSKYPVVSFTVRQEAAISSILNEPQNEEKYVEFLLSLADQTYNNDPHECTLICILSFMSLERDLTYKSAKNSTTIFAAILRVYKALVIYQCKPTITANNRAIEKCKELTAKYLTFPEDVRCSPSAMSWVIQMFRYAARVANDYTEEGTIYWRNSTEISFRGICFTMVDFRTAVHNKIEKAKVMLLKLCECETMNKLPAIYWSSICDNMNDGTNDNYSFVYEKRNNFVARSREFNQQRDLSKWIVDGSFDNNKVKQFKCDVKSFLELMLPLVHVTSGQPARGSEITILQHCNSIKGDRNIYIYKEMVCIHARYNKNMMVTNRSKPIFRYLPLRVGELLVYYLWLVLPFYHTVVGKHDSCCYRSSFLFTDDIVSKTFSESTWSSGMFSSMLKNFFGTSMGVTMNISSYRHVAIAIARRWLNITVHSKADIENNFDDLQIDHDDKHDNDTLHDDIWDLQAGHTTQTALRVYARNVNENMASDQATMDKYYAISTMWHDFMFLSSSSKSNPIFRNMNLLEETLKNQRINRFNSLQRFLSSPLDMLRYYLRSESATFRGNQLETITEIVKGTQCILQIAGTGVGKSISFMLPAFFAPSGTTIVIVPLILLQVDLLHRCHESGINAKLWNGIDHDFSTTESIVFVTPESSISDKFLDYLNLLKEQHQLDRLVFDECHMLLSSTDTFRKKMADIFELVKAACCQLVLLTATLPKSSENELFDHLKMNNSTFKIIRDATTRKNIAYSVRTVSVGQSHMNELVRTIEEEFVEGKCIIYVRSIQLGDEVAKKIEVDFFHAQAIGKAQMYRKWLESDKSEIIVATNALGCGIDVPNIRCVIHFGSPKSLLDFAQESGRAGRDGCAAKSILINIPLFDFSLDNHMEKYINSNECRRCQLDLVMDNRDGRQKCMAEENENSCDFCLFDADCMKLDIDEIIWASHQHDNNNNNSNNSTFLKMTSDDSVPTVTTSIQTETKNIKNDRRLTEGHVMLIREDHQRKRARVEVSLEYTVDEKCKQLLQELSSSGCMVCSINCSKSTCSNSVMHRQLNRQALKQANDFMAKYKSARYKIEPYLVCFTCLLPQQWWWNENNSKCNHEHKNTMLTAIYLIALLDSTFFDQRYSDNNYMLQTVGHFGTIEKAIRLTKLFYENVVEYRKRHNVEI